MGIVQQNSIMITGAGISKQYIKATNVVLQDHSTVLTSKLQFQGDKRSAVVGEDRSGSKAGTLTVTAQMTKDLYALLLILHKRDQVRGETARGDFKGFVYLQELPEANYNNEVTFAFLFERNELVD